MLDPDNFEDIGPVADLSDDELVARLVARGMSETEAKRVVAERD